MVRPETSSWFAKVIESEELRVSEPVTCPECGASVTARKPGDFDQSIKLRCQSCGAVFEYIPGFGSFSEQGNEGRAAYGGSFPSRDSGDLNYGYEPGADIQTGGGAGGGVAIACCLLLAFMLPLFYALFMVIAP